MGITYEFSKDSGVLGGRAELRPTWSGTDTLNGELMDIVFADDGVNFTLRITRGEDKNGNDVSGETTGVALWWIKLPDGGEQLKGSGSGGLPARGGFTPAGLTVNVRLDRINPK